MLPLQIRATTKPPGILLLGAHCDDIEIGMGATLRRLCARHPDSELHWITLSSNETRAAETRLAASHLLAGARNASVVVRAFRESYFPQVGAELKDYFETLKASFRPDVVFTHLREDAHQDHRMVNDLTWNTFRDQLILEYEVPKFDGDLRTPNHYVPITRVELDAKIEVLMTCYTSQLHRAWFTPETFRGLARLRGIECNAPDGFAEAFHCRKAVLGI